MPVFHPQFEQLLRFFVSRAPYLMLQFRDPTAHAKSTARPVRIDPSLRFNAGVGRAEDGYPVYSVSAGAIAALLDACLSLRAIPDFLPEVPVIGRVIETRTTRQPDHFLNYEHLCEEHDVPIPLIPLLELIDDPSRDSLSNVVLDLASRFLMLHEQMHFLRGHLHYLLGRAAPGAFEEIPRGTPSPELLADRRALELDADAGAVSTLLGLFEEGVHQEILGGLAWLAQTEAQWTRLVAVASLLVMLLLSLGDQASSEHVASRSHPTVPARMLNILLMTSHHLRQRLGGGERRPPPEVFSMFQDITALARLLGTERPESQSLVEWKAVDAAQFRHPTCIELRDLQARFMQIAPNLR